MEETSVDINCGQEFAPGTVMGGYRIERKLGRGNMSVVYLATQLNIGRPVAFKVLSAELSADREYVLRFFNEARSAAQFSHVHIVQAYDAGQSADGIYYFCMEYVDGETLLNVIQRESKLEPLKCCKWFRQIAEALLYGWSNRRLTHGDIKPENIMIDRNGNPKLTDFGLARVEGHDYAGKTLLLTPLYAAPELIRRTCVQPDCRPDIYAFGASMYHALAGTPPFPGDDAQTVMDRQLHETLEPLNLRNSRIDADLSVFVGQMLCKEPAERLQTWEEVIRGLDALIVKFCEPCSKDHDHSFSNAPLSNSSACVTESRNRRRKRVKKELWLIALLAVLAAILSVLLVMLNRQEKLLEEELKQPALTVQRKMN